MHATNSSRRSRKSGFSMTELLVVVGVMAALMAVAAPSLTGLNPSGRLTSAGNQLVDLANMARQNAATRNAMTALVVVTNSGDTKLDYRVFCLMECKADGTGWQQISKWQFFPDGVKIDPNTASDPFLSNVPSVDPALGSLKCFTKTVPAGSYAFQVFLPDGSMEAGSNPGLATQAPVLRVVSDRYGDNNYYQITFNQFTGGTKVQRP